MYDIGTQNMSFENELKRLEVQAKWGIEQEIRALRSLLVNKSLPRILEVGSGPGFITGHILNLLDMYCDKIVCVEPNVEFYQYAFEKFHDNRQIELECKTFDQYQRSWWQNGEKFDLIYFRFVLQHLSQPENMLLQAKNILKENGILVVMDTDDRCGGCVEPFPSLKPTLSALYNFQKSNGGDRNIGSYIAEMMKLGGLKNINNTILVRDISVLGDEGLHSLLDPQGFWPVVNAGFLSIEEFLRYERDYYAYKNRTIKTGYVNNFFVSGVKCG